MKKKFNCWLDESTICYIKSSAKELNVSCGEFIRRILDKHKPDTFTKPDTYSSYISIDNIINN